MKNEKQLELIPRNFSEWLAYGGHQLKNWIKQAAENKSEKDVDLNPQINLPLSIS